MVTRKWRGGQRTTIRHLYFSDSVQRRYKRWLSSGRISYFSKTANKHLPCGFRDVAMRMMRYECCL